MPRQQADVLIAAGDWIVGRAVQKTLETAGYRVVDVVATAREAFAAAQPCRPDVALVDVELGDGLTGIDLARQLRARFAVSVVYLSAHSDVNTLSRAAETEPAGFVVKPFREDQLLSAVAMAQPPAGTGENGDGRAATVRRRRAHQVAVAISEDTPSLRDSMTLTQRELDVVRLLLANGRVRSIAEQLHISQSTVRNHLASIFCKVGVHSQVELIRELTKQRAA